MASNITIDFENDNATNESLNECFVLTSLEPITNEWIQLGVILLYSLTALASFIGNSIVLVVQIFGTESSKSIRKYLNNLAVSDITISVMSIPFTYTNNLMGRWIFPHWLCPTAQFFQLLSVFITSTTLTIIGIER